MKTKGSYKKGHAGYWLGKSRKGTFSKEFGEKMSKLSVGRRPSDSPNWRPPNTGKHPSLETRLKQSIARLGRFVGKDAGNWKGGITPVNMSIRTSLEYKLWRTAVFERDKYTCIWCGRKGVVLHADHIKPFALYPELRFAIDNGRTLCKECHSTTDTYCGRGKIYVTNAK